EAENQVAELLGSFRRIAQRALQEVAEDDADADAGAAHADTCNAGPDKFRCCSVHKTYSRFPFELLAVSGRGEGRRSGKCRSTVRTRRPAGTPPKIRARRAQP